MFNETIPLPDIEQTVLRPSVYQVIDQVRDMLGMAKDVEIIYAGKRGVVQATGSALSDMQSVNEAKFSPDNYVVIEAIEDYDVEAVQEIQSHSFDTAPIFSDPKLDFSLRPIYLPSKVEITFTYQSISETEVRQWITNQITKANRGRDTFLHNIVYTYPIPYEFLAVLDDIHTLREKNEGYGQTLMEYFNQHRVNRFNLISDQAGKKLTPVVQEKQGQIVGAFDFVVSPEKPEFIKEKGVFSARFVYRYTYWRPDACYIRFPIAVHNEFLPSKYITRLSDIPDDEKTSAFYSHGMNAMQLFSLASNRNAVRSPSPFINIPNFDTFHPTVKEHTATVFCARCFLDDTKKDLISLTDLGDYELDPDILDFLKTEAPYLHKPFFSVFGVEHYINGQLQSYDKIEVTPDLMVRSLEPLSMRDVHHVRLFGMPEINQALYDALKRVSEHPKAFVKVVSALNKLIAEDPDFGSLRNCSKIELWMLTSVYRILQMSNQGNIYSQGNNLNNYVLETVFSDKNALGLLTKLDPKYIQMYLDNRRRMRFTVMNSAIIVKPRHNM